MNPTLPVEWLSLVKSCNCIPCLALVRAWTKARPTDVTARRRRSFLSLVLTPVETQTLQCVARGLSNKEIGIELNNAESTVKNRLTILMSRLGVHGRVQVALRAIELGIANDGHS